MAKDKLTNTVIYNDFSFSTTDDLKMNQIEEQDRPIQHLVIAKEGTDAGNKYN